MTGHLFFSNACQAPAKDPTSAKTGAAAFFDLPGYFEGEIERLQSTKSVYKQVHFKDQQESTAVDNWNPEIDLQPFKDLTINKSAWGDKYQVDTLVSDTIGRYGIQYTALEDKLQIRDVQVWFQDERPTHILVNKKIDTPIAETSQRLSYIADQGFSISSEQSTFFNQGYEAGVEVRWEE